MKIKINGNYYDHFNDFTMSDQLDTCAATFAFTARYDHENSDKTYQAIFRPLGFQKVEFFDDNEVLFFTGTIINHDFNSKPAPQYVLLSGYSLGGVLEDCTIPYKVYPKSADTNSVDFDGATVNSFESAGRTLKEITSRLLGYFNLQLVIDRSVTNECSQRFVKSVAKPRGTIKDYLCKLAAQKNVVMSHGIKGEIVYFRPDVNAKSIGLFTGENTLDMSFKINGQGLHSDITTIRQASKETKVDFDSAGGAGSADSIKNNLVKVFRPYVDLLSSGSGKDTIRGAKNALADELRNIKLTFSLTYWAQIKTGDILEVQNPEIRLHSVTRFIVENTTISEKAPERTMSVTCVLPESFTGGQPKDIFAV